MYMQTWVTSLQTPADSFFAKVLQKIALQDNMGFYPYCQLEAVTPAFFTKLKQ